MTLAYSELSQISKIESFRKMVNCFLSKLSILDVRQGFEYAYGIQSKLDWSNKCVLLKKPSVFITLPIIQNQSTYKTIPHIVLKTFINNNSRFKTQKISWWVVWVGDASNIYKSFCIKNHYWNLKLSVVALSSVIKRSPWKWKKYHQKNARYLNNNKNSSHDKRYKKDIEKGKNEKWKA